MVLPSKIQHGHHFFLLAPLRMCLLPIINFTRMVTNIMAKGLPLVYIFEEARSILINNVVNYSNITSALILNLIYFTSAVVIFYLAFLELEKKEH